MSAGLAGQARARFGRRTPRPAAPARAPALVMGDADLVRPLALAGIPCAVLATPDAPVRRSRHVAEALPWIDHWERQTELADALLVWAARQPQAPVLMPQTDGDLLTASRHRDRLARRFHLALADAELVEALVDKVRFSALAGRLGLPVPAARQVRAAACRPEDLDLRFPLVVKPARRHYAEWALVEAAAKARHVETAADLAALWPTLAEADVELVVQEAVPGDETQVESHHAYVDASGTVVAEFTGRKIRTRPARYGHSTALELTDRPDVAALGREMLAALGLRGVAKTDFKRAPDGRLHLLEVNPRFTLWHHPAALAGVNVPAIVHADLTGAPRPPTGPARTGVRWVLPLDDLRAARAQGIGLGAWLRFAAGCEARSGLSRDDPWPFAEAAWGPIRRRLARR